MRERRLRAFAPPGFCQFLDGYPQLKLRAIFCRDSVATPGKDEGVLREGERSGARGADATLLPDEGGNRSRQYLGGAATPPCQKLLREWVDDVVVGGWGPIEHRFIEGWIEDNVGEVVAEAGAVGEGKFRAGEGVISAGEADLELGHHLARGGAFGLQREMVGAVGFGEREDMVFGIEFIAAAREAGIQEREGGAKLGRGIVAHRIEFGAFKVGIDDIHLVVMADGHGLGRVAEFPAEIVGHGKRDVAVADEGLGQGFERAGLDEVGGPGLDFLLGGEPGVEDGIGIGGAEGLEGEKDGQEEETKGVADGGL